MTVHKDVTERLEVLNNALYLGVRAVLDKNLSERHIRGGIATKNKYINKKSVNQDNANINALFKSNETANTDKESNEIANTDKESNEIANTDNDSNETTNAVNESNITTGAYIESNKGLINVNTDDKNKSNEKRSKRQPSKKVNAACIHNEELKNQSCAAYKNADKSRRNECKNCLLCACGLFLSCEKRQHISCDVCPKRPKN